MPIEPNNHEENKAFELVIRAEDFWLNDAFKGLQSAYQQNKFPHGLLLNAPNGFGQLKLAKAVAASLLCRNNQSAFIDNDSIDKSPQESQLNLSSACGDCKSCLLLKSNTHPDFNLVERLVEKGKLKQNIGIDQIRNLTQKLVQTSQLQGWRIVIINSVEHMNISSFNAILKTLEEPGQNTLIMLINNGMGIVPATIKSRCQMLNLKADKNKTLDWLINQGLNKQDLEKQVLNTIDKSVASNAIEICHGAPYASLEFILQGYYSDYTKLFADLDAVLTNRISANVLLAQHKQQMSFLISWIANYFHHVSQLVVLGNEQRYKQVPHKTVSTLYDQLISLNKAQSGGSNLQLPLQLEAILIQWFELGRKIVHYSK